MKSRRRTRIDKPQSITEQQIREIIERTKKLVICNYPAKDLDRFLSFFNATKDTDRDLIIDLRQAYVLKLFHESERWKDILPMTNGIDNQSDQID